MTETAGSGGTRRRREQQKGPNVIETLYFSNKHTPYNLMWFKLIITVCSNKLTIVYKYTLFCHSEAVRKQVEQNLWVDAWQCDLSDRKYWLLWQEGLLLSLSQTPILPFLQDSLNRVSHTHTASPGHSAAIAPIYPIPWSPVKTSLHSARGTPLNGFPYSRADTPYKHRDGIM